MVQLVLFACISHWLLIVRHKASKLETRLGKTHKFASPHRALGRIEPRHPHGRTLMNPIVKDDESSVFQRKS